MLAKSTRPSVYFNRKERRWLLWIIFPSTFMKDKSLHYWVTMVLGRLLCLIS